MAPVSHGRVRVLVSRDGSALNVTRVDEVGNVLSVIWQREVSDADQPLTAVFEQLPEPNRIFGQVLTFDQAEAELFGERQIAAYREAIAARLAAWPREAVPRSCRSHRGTLLPSRWAVLRLASSRAIEALRRVLRWGRA